MVKAHVRLFVVFILLVGLLGIQPVRPAYAAMLIVTNTNDSGIGSLRDTLAEAGAGDTITFAAGLSGQTIFLASTLDITQNVTIDGSALASPITISGDSDNDGTGNVRVFSMGINVTTRLDSLVITKGVSSFGGGIFNNGDMLTVINSTVSGNAAADGGGIFSRNTLTVTNSTISGNSGSGIRNNIGTLTITNSTISSNDGGISSSGETTITNSTFSGNTTTGFGGGLFIDSGDYLTITNSTFSGNSAVGKGGGIYSGDFSGNTTITNSTFSGNTSTGDGGGIYSNFTSTIINSTFSGNTATNTGGGIRHGGTLTITNSTFSGNSASTGGGIRNGATLHYVNTIIANSPSGGDCSNGGVLITSTNNLVEDNTCDPSQSGDPALGPLADNGGPTQTFALLTGSPAIDAGNNNTCAFSAVSNLDQRGETRPVDGDTVPGAICDIGAYEYFSKSITAFDFSSPAATGVVTEATHTIALTVPYGTDVTALTPTITHTGVSVSPDSGVANNFTNPVTYTVTADDSSTQDYTVTVTVAPETAAPDTTIDSQPSDPDTDNTPTFTFSGSDGTPGSGVAFFECKMDGGSYTACASPFTSSALTDGLHTFYVKAIDNLANQDATPDSYTWTLDTTRPDTTIDSQPSDPDTDNTPTFTFSGNDGAGSGIASFQCKIYGGSYAACASPFTLPALSNGIHTFYVKAIDNTANQDATPDTYTWTLDATTPAVTAITRANMNPSSAASVDFTVTFSESVTGVDTTDFSLTSTVSGASIASVSADSGSTRTITVNTGSGNGTIRLDLNSSGTNISDLVGNTLSGGFTSGETYNIDKTVTLSFTSTNTQDGWVLESSETSNRGGTFNSTATTFNLGDDAAKKQYRGILSFNTSSIPDSAIITSVMLKVKRQSITGGGNPVTTFQGFMIDIRKSFFGTSALQTTDFQAAANKTYGPFNPPLVINWYSINLTSGKLYINKLSAGSGLTQIRLRFKLDDNNNALANYLSLFSGNAPATARPQLIIQYVP